MHRHILAAIAFILVGGEAATGQSDSAPPIGQRVRMRCVVSPHCFVHGTLVAIRADSVELTVSGAKQTWALSDFDRVHRSVGQRRHARMGLLGGAFVGVLGGAIGGLASGDDTPCAFCLDRLSAGEKALGFGLGVGLIGAIVGAVLGALAVTENWEDVSALVLGGAPVRAPEHYAVP
jgi:hypothetical protein